MVCFDDILKNYNAKIIIISVCGVIERINEHARLSPTIFTNKKTDLDLKCRKCKSEKTKVHKHNKISVVSTHILKLYLRYMIQFLLHFIRL